MAEVDSLLAGLALLTPNAPPMQIRDSAGDPTPTGVAAAGAGVVVVAGGAAAAAGGSTWIPAVIALVAAVFVAVLTAITTNRRQAKQLADEGTRQAEFLAAERERLKLELAHQRDLGELAHLREFFDEAAALLEERIEAVTAFSKARKSSKAAYADVEAAGDSSIAAHRAMDRHWRRMTLRLPFDHPVTVTYHEAGVALSKRVEELHKARKKPDALDTEADTEADDTLANEVIAAFAQFVEAARAELDRRAAVEPDRVRGA